MYLWEACGVGAMMSVMAVKAKTEECASRQSKHRKRCEDREGDDVTTYVQIPAECDLGWCEIERIGGRMYGRAGGI